MGKEHQKVRKQIKFEQKIENLLNETNLDKNGEIQLEGKNMGKVGEYDEHDGNKNKGCEGKQIGRKESTN